MEIALTLDMLPRKHIDHKVFISRRCDFTLSAGGAHVGQCASKYDCAMFRGTSISSAGSCPADGKHNVFTSPVYARTDSIIACMFVWLGCNGACVAPKRCVP